MDKIVWLDKYNTGIAEIDTQHRQIAEYLNQLREAHLQRSQQAIKEVLEGITDYTWSHFAFEEALMEQAAYNFAKAHKNVHEMFIKRVDTFVSRFQAGEDITEEQPFPLSTILVQEQPNPVNIIQLMPLLVPLPDGYRRQLNEF